ncbi:hypothetical protein ACN4AC_002058 [Klebsiella pneumoniae]|uniref:hypothetical protein n=2 Tax=Klebsiella pneumoniae TaxID=573 RepID=UPI000E2DC882|nr:hypothetical protein [Klebsiella pneumoniae]EKJ7312579.1 hypothetical protein [Klebsiella pneumoniae]EKW0390933.1 hypothetical protein [Klebsiella pneumoniae]ELA0688784.1 hypothetical protein [Klebsiella pneumoniae]MBZ7030879.1 hypothetical protein [Klebsiella pneumoniae]SXI89971.1 Uncharacterised protein [Klebsiella pneumoniae]
MTATVTGPFEVRKNLTLGAGVKLYRDQTITPETKAVFDFASDWAGGNKAQYKNLNTLKNLNYVDDAITINANDSNSNAQNYGSGGGIYSATGQNLGVKLPESAYPTPDMSRFMFTVWAKWPADKLINPANTNWALLYAGSGEGNLSDDVSTAFKIGGVRQVDDGTDVPINSLYVYGVRVTYPSEAQTKIKAVVGQSKPFQYGVEVVRDKNLNNFYCNFYLNGELIGTSPTHTPLAIPTVTNAYVLGNLSRGYCMANTVFYRVRLDDLSGSTRLTADLIADDYTKNKGYFS